MTARMIGSGHARALTLSLTFAVLTAAAQTVRLPPGTPDARGPGNTGTDIEAACKQLQPGGWRPAEGSYYAPIVETPRPAQAQPLIDPVYRACVVRISAHDQDPVRGFARNDYSRRQAFNADDSRVIVVSNDGYWHLYDPKRATYVKQLHGIGGDAEPQWHAKNPDLLYFFPNNGVGMKLLELNVKTDAVRTVADFASRIQPLWPRAMTAWTKSEGSPSANQRYWAFMVDSDKWQGLGLFVYDLQEDKIVGTYDLAKNGKDRPDHVSMSPSGEFIVVSFLDSVVAFKRDFSQPRVLQKKSEHSDLALLANGHDAYVAIDYERSGGPVFMIDLQTGDKTTLFDTYIDRTATAVHFSGRAFDKPGWVLMSTYGDYSNRGGSDPKWLHRKIFAVQLQANPRIVHLAAHHSYPNEYFTEPHASVNRSFTRVMFNSNWGTKSKNDIDAFMLVLPPELLSATAAKK
ncbi:MAG: hypothetical protein ABI574_14850 [Burkholderiales bacterium]